MSAPFPPFKLDQVTGEIIATVSAFLIIWFANMALTGWLAGRKGREDGTWAVLALFFGPFALIAILLKAPKPRKSEADRALAAVEAPGQVRLASDSELELETGGRLARLRGQVAARINGRPSFSLARSTEWRWSDDRPMTDDDRAQLRREIPGIGRRDGWILTLDAEDR
jgi:hypothetical protein